LELTFWKKRKGEKGEEREKRKRNRFGFGKAQGASNKAI